MDQLKRLSMFTRGLILVHLAVLFCHVRPVSAQSPDIVIYANDIKSIYGAWTRTPDPTAAGGNRLGTADAAVATFDPPLSNPTHYLDVTFTAPSNTSYRLWMRLKATANSKFNDSVWVQFSDAMAGGSPIYPIGSGSALNVNLATDFNATSLNAWGWCNTAYWLNQTTTFMFASTGPHTMRIQVREDGVQLDQIVLSPQTFLSSAPGGPTNDSTIVAKPAGPPDVVIYANDVINFYGGWTKPSDTTAAGGIKLSTVDAGAPTVETPLSAPTHYFDVAFAASANTSYRLWMRLKATGNSKFNDSLWVQFSDAQVGGAPIYPLNSTSALNVNLATDFNATSLQAWGWQNTAYWLNQANTFTFANSGSHTMRVQVREDGVQVDQIVLSPQRYMSLAPGVLTNDSTIVAKSTTNTPPTITITSPTTGVPYGPAASITISASAADSDGSITKVEFFANETLIGPPDTTPPYSIVWSPGAVNSYRIVARATDNNNDATNSLVATVNVVSCTYDINPTSTSVGSSATSSSFSVTAPGGCSWQATSQVAWISTTSAGAGSGSVAYSVFNNSTTVVRTGTIVIAGRTYSLTQDAPSTSGTTTCDLANPNDEVDDTQRLQDCLDNFGTVNLVPGNPGYLIGSFGPGLILRKPGTRLTNDHGGQAKITAAPPVGGNSGLTDLMLKTEGEPAGFEISWLYFDGNRLKRSNAACVPGHAPGNISVGGDGFWVHHIQSVGALCGTGLGVGGSNYKVHDNTVSNNGTPVDEAHPPGTIPWSDGITVGYCLKGKIYLNRLDDNSDVDLMLGGGIDCEVHDNEIRHAFHFAFAGMAIGYMDNGLNGNHAGTTYDHNQVYGDVAGRVGIGILVGPHAWDVDQWASNMTVTNNYATGAAANLVVDGIQSGTVQSNTYGDTFGHNYGALGLENTSNDPCVLSPRYAAGPLDHEPNSVLQPDYEYVEFTSQRACHAYTPAEPPPPPIPTGYFYWDIQYLGASFSATDSMPFVFDWNDQISSVRVPPGKTLRLYEHADYQGDYLELTSDEVDLRNHPGPGPDGTWNDVVSSFQIF